MARGLTCFHFFCFFLGWRWFWHKKKQFNQNGFAVIENFLSVDEILAIFEAGQKLCIDAPKEDRKIFSADRQEKKSAQNREEYFLNSSDKIRYFFEDGALDDNGELLVDPLIALNKVKLEAFSINLHD